MSPVNVFERQFVNKARARAPGRVPPGPGDRAAGGARQLVALAHSLFSPALGLHEDYAMRYRGLCQQITECGAAL